MAGGSPKYTKAVADKICDGVAQGKSLDLICKPAEMPSPKTVYAWLREDKYKGFREQYAIAREEQGDYWADRIATVAVGLEKAVSHVEVEGKKAAIDAFKWLAGTRKPKVYGNLQKLEHTGAGGSPLTVIIERSSDGS